MSLDSAGVGSDAATSATATAGREQNKAKTMATMVRMTIPMAVLFNRVSNQSGNLSLYKMNVLSQATPSFIKSSPCLRSSNVP